MATDSTLDSMEQSGTGQVTSWPSWELSPPPEGHKDVARWAWTKFQVMVRWRDAMGLPQLWKNFHDLYRGKYFKGAPRYTKTIANLVFKAINSSKAHLTDQKPRADFSARGDASEDSVKTWMAAYDEWWDRTQQQGKLTKSVGKSELYGFQTDKVIFNAMLEGGLGEVDTIRTNTFGFVTWPGYMEIQDCPMVCHFDAIELGRIYQTWPEHKDKVTAEAQYSDLLGSERSKTRASRAGASDVRPIGTIPGYVIPEGGENSGDRDADIPRALVIELWVKDYTFVNVNPQTGEEMKKGEKIPPVMVQDQQTGGWLEQPVEPVKQPKYPGFIRCITVTNGGGLLLSDVPNPSINPNLPRTLTSKCYLYDKYPFIKRMSYDDDISEYGISVIEQIANLAVEFSKKLSQISTHLDYSTRPVLILPQNSGVRRDDINNLPNRIWEPLLNLASQIRFLPMPSLPPDYMAFLELIMRLIDIITGLTDVSEGRKPAGITAGVAIAALQEKAQTIIRDKIRALDIYIEEQGRMYIALGQNWYTEERVLVFEEQAGVKRQEGFTGTDPSMAGEVAIKVESGSTLPNNRWAQREQSLQLFQAGVIDQEALLEEFQVPKRDVILSRMKAGPLGMAMDKLKQSGMFDDQTLQALGEILSMPDDEFKKAFPGTQNPYLQAAE